MVLAQITNVEILLKQNYAATLYKNAIFFLPLNALICGKNYQQRVDNQIKYCPVCIHKKLAYSAFCGKFTHSDVSIGSGDGDDGLEGALVLTDGGAVRLVDEHRWVLVTQNVHNEQSLNADQRWESLIVS